MTLEELLEPYKGLCGDASVNDRLQEMAINCLSLSETWLNGRTSKSYKMEKIGNDGNIIQTLFGLTKDNLPQELMRICLEKPKDVVSIKVYDLVNDGKRINSVRIGVLDIL